MDIYNQFLHGKNGIVFIGFGATYQEKKAGGVFCKESDSVFWDILKDAGLISDVIKQYKTDVPYVQMAEDVFYNGSLCLMEEGMGYTTLFDHQTIEKNKWGFDYRYEENNLYNRLYDAKPKKIVLLGTSVAYEFFRKFPKSINKLFPKFSHESNTGFFDDKYFDIELKKIIASTLEEKMFDYQGIIDVFGSPIQVYIVPFPEKKDVDTIEYFKRII